MQRTCTPVSLLRMHVVIYRPENMKATENSCLNALKHEAHEAHDRLFKSLIPTS
jgi:hypothetical protein